MNMGVMLKGFCAHDLPRNRYQGLCRGKNGCNAKLTTCAHLVPRLGMQGHSLPRFVLIFQGGDKRVY